MFSIRLRSKRLHRLFNEVLAELPPAERADLENRTLWVADDPVVILPEVRPKKRPIALTYSISVTKSIFIVYFNRAQLRQESKDFVKAVIAHELAAVRHADPAPPPEAVAHTSVATPM